MHHVPPEGMLLADLPKTILRENNINPHEIDHRVAYNFGKLVRSYVNSLKTNGLLHTETTNRPGNLQKLILIKRNYPIKTQQ